MRQSRQVGNSHAQPPAFGPGAGLPHSISDASARGRSWRRPVVSLTQPPAGYADWLADLKGRIHTAQQRATLAVNCELVLLYWQIGRDILARQAEQGWGPR
ncbi:MAG: DUF1016 N-terminal domain-containing protein [Thiobacillus sp.]|nr:DUF1016 N-terminal domain-containing protein [Thiobacillus sp.]